MAKKKQDYPADFLAFYQAYPKERHQGYVAPFKSWSSLEKKGELPELSVILKAIEEQKTTRGWLNGYIPMMTTWLNQKRWEAEVQDNALAKEQAEKRKQQRVTAFCNTQEEVITEWYDKLTQWAAYNKYNLLKLAPVFGGYLHPVVDTLVLNSITLYIPEPENPLSMPCAILDAFCDIMNLRCKGCNWTEEAVVATCEEYPNTVLMLVCGRYCDSLGIDSLPSHVSITPKESVNLRKLLTHMLDPDVCLLYRERYGYKAFFAPDTWLNAFTPDAILENFQEVI
jgi:hypothetical protein